MMRQNGLFGKIWKTLCQTRKEGTMKKPISNALKSFSP